MEETSELGNDTAISGQLPAKIGFPSTRP